MEIKKQMEQDTIVIRITGEVDSSNVSDLEKSLLDAVSGQSDVIIDLGELEYVSSAGLRVFLMIQKKMNEQGKLLIRNMNEEVLDIFTVTGFTKLLNLAV